ncbi:MAG: twin-arginine translocase TatA/TatE family subunit [Nitrospinae bacterium]|nr:twin-arginine translocase TatA/TatE family subunit [Nitrospinota bacterium]
MFGIGMSELVIILIIILIIFGAGKLPEIGAGVGKGIRNFKKGMKEINDDVDVTHTLKEGSSDKKEDKGIKFEEKKDS